MFGFCGDSRPRLSFERSSAPCQESLEVADSWAIYSEPRRYFRITQKIDFREYNAPT